MSDGPIFFDEPWYWAQPDTVKPPEKPAELFPIGTHVRWHDAGEDASTGIVITHVAYAGPTAGWPIVEWKTHMGEITDQENPEWLRVIEPAFKIGHKVTWRASQFGGAVGTVVEQIGDSYRVEWRNDRDMVIYTTNPPEYLKAVKAVQPEAVEPKGANWTPEWGKWWWDTRHTRGRMPEPPYKKGGQYEYTEEQLRNFAAGNCGRRP